MKNKKYLICYLIIACCLFLNITYVSATCYKTNKSGNDSYSTTKSSNSTVVDDYYCRVNMCAIASTKKGTNGKFTYINESGKKVGARGCGDCGRQYSWDDTRKMCDLSDYEKNYKKSVSCSQSAKSESECLACNSNQSTKNICGSNSNCGYKWTTSGCVPYASESEEISNTSQSSTIISSTKVSCGNITGIPKKVPEITSYIVTMIEIIVPIILVIFGTLDLFKGITANKEEEMKKGYQIFIKRLILAALVFFVIAIVKFVTSIVDSASSGDVSSCMDCFLRNSCKE